MGTEKENGQEPQGNDLLDLEARLTLAAGRMKPHFIHNILTSIYYLCDMDTEKAQDTISAFSEYLRNTLETIDRPGMAPFSRELNQIKNYLMLEKLRFEDRLHVKYDIECEDFLIAPLTIEPLVENAVKHGIANLDGPGTVRVVTRRLDDGGIQIRVIDNGIGFDVAQVQAETDHHNEVENVKRRIRNECGGDMSIITAPGKGTTVIVMLPESASFKSDT